MHKITNTQGRREADCIGRSNGTRWFCVCRWHQTHRVWGPIQDRWLVVLHASCPLSAGWLPGRETPWSNLLLKVQDMCACSCRNSTVNLILLRCSGAIENIVRACISFSRTTLSQRFGSAEYWNLADGRFATAKLLVPQCLDSCDLITIRKFFWKAWRYIDAYRYFRSHIGARIYHTYLLISRFQKRT